MKPSKESPTFISDEICFTAVRMSEHLNAKTIIGMTHSGYTGIKISSYRPNCDIFIFTHNHPVLRTLNLVWGYVVFIMKTKKVLIKRLAMPWNF